MCRVRVPCQHAGRQPVGRRSTWSLRTLVPAGRPRGPCCYLSPASADDAKLIYVSPRAGPAARIRFPPLVKTRTETEWRVRARGSLTRERGGRVGFWGWCEGSGRGHGFSGAGPRRPAEQSGGTAPTGARGRLRPPLPTASRGRQHGPRTGRLPILPPFARGRFASWGGAGESITETPRKREPRSCSPYVTGLESFSAARRATRKPRYADPAPPHEVREGAHRWPDTQVGRKEAHMGESVTGRRRPAEPSDRCRPRRVSGAGLGLPSPAPGRVCSCPSVPSDGLGFLPLLVDAAAPMAVTSPWLYSLFLLISLLPRYESFSVLLCLLISGAHCRRK